MATREDVFKLVRANLPDQKLSGKGVTLDYLRRELLKRTNLTREEIYGEESAPQTSKMSDNLGDLYDFSIPITLREEVARLGKIPNIPGFNWKNFWENLAEIRGDEPLPWTIIHSLIHRGSSTQFLKLFKWVAPFVLEDSAYVDNYINEHGDLDDDEDAYDRDMGRTQLIDDIIGAFRQGHIEYAKILLSGADFEWNDNGLVRIFAHLLGPAEVFSRWKDESSKLALGRITKALEYLLETYPDPRPVREALEYSQTNKIFSMMPSDVIRSYYKKYIR